MSDGRIATPRRAVPCLVGIVALTITLLAGLIAFTASRPRRFDAPGDGRGTRRGRCPPFGCAAMTTLATHVRNVPRVFRLAFSTGAIVMLAQLAVLSAFIVNPNLGVWGGDAVAPLALGALVCLVFLGPAATQATASHEHLRRRPVFAAAAADSDGTAGQPRRMGALNIDVCLTTRRRSYRCRG